MINPKIKRLAATLERDENEPGGSHRIVLDMVGSGKRVLEFGFPVVELSQLLAAAGNRVTAIESDERDVEAARAACEEVVAGDAETRPLGELVPGRAFDAVVCDDALEYARDPRRLLEEARNVLAPGGYAVLTARNVAHGSIRLALLRGRFEAPSGLRERPVLRFFTLKTLGELCFRAGFRVVEVARTKAPIVMPEGPAQKFKADDFEREILREIEADPEHDTLQFIIRAAPLGDEERLSALVDIAVEAELRSEAVRAKLLVVEEEAEALRRRAAELEENARRASAAGMRAEAELRAATARLDQAERAASEAAARFERLPHLERAVAEAAERVAAANARGETLAEQLLLANERVAEYERRSESARAESATYRAKAVALRAALERAGEELAEARRAGSASEAASEVEVADLRSAIVAAQERAARAESVADEAGRERDSAFAAREAAEAARRQMLNDLREAQAADEKRAARVEDLRFELERESATLRTVMLERDRIRHEYDAQQSAAGTFYAHVEAELARTRREITHIDGMIRGVQTSKWWTIKRALGKAKRVVVAKIRR